MMFEHADGAPVLHLTEDQSWQLLDKTKHGRIALYAGVEVDIFPVNFSTTDRVIYVRTAPGSKLDELTINPKVAFEADGILSDEAWSVIVHGTAKNLETEAEIATARESGVTPWVPTTKESWVSITPTAVTGRHFVFGKQPELDDEI
jgi:nitroimidazol reductase NimA-like FMN-containing flavoprotein (pyridoxamine 5'-phosphate oxidase superfamily)